MFYAMFHANQRRRDYLLNRLLLATAPQTCPGVPEMQHSECCSPLNYFYCTWISMEIWLEIFGQKCTELSASSARENNTHGGSDPKAAAVSAIYSPSRPFFRPRDNTISWRIWFKWEDRELQTADGGHGLLIELNPEFQRLRSKVRRMRRSRALPRVVDRAVEERRANGTLQTHETANVMQLFIHPTGSNICKC